jgi:hypothetical protein
MHAIKYINRLFISQTKTNYISSTRKCFLLETSAKNIVVSENQKRKNFIIHNRKQKIQANK